MAWEWGAETKALPGALGSLIPVHRKPPLVRQEREREKEEKETSREKAGC